MPFDPIPNRATEFAPFPTRRSPVVQDVGIPRVRVPDPVTGELVTENPVGAAKPTDVTPVPPEQIPPASIRLPAASDFTQFPLVNVPWTVATWEVDPE